MVAPAAVEGLVFNAPLHDGLKSDQTDVLAARTGSVVHGQRVEGSAPTSRMQGQPLCDRVDVRGVMWARYVEVRLQPGLAFMYQSRSTA